MSQQLSGKDTEYKCRICKYHPLFLRKSSTLESMDISQTYQSLTKKQTNKKVCDSV